MYSNQILGVLQVADKCLKQLKTNVYAADRVPLKRRKGAFIFNTENHDKLGQHWIAVFVPSKGGVSEYFDSFGKNAPPKFRKFLKPPYKYNPHQIQSHLSETCGIHCIYYLANRCRNVPPTIY